MMNFRSLVTFFIVFVYTFSFSQITDTTKVVSKTKQLEVNDSLSRSSIVIDSSKFYIDTTRAKKIDSTKLSKYITLKKTLLDSLLKPYYSIRIDSIKNDTIVNAAFSSKYRVFIDAFTKDTTYIPLPKTTEFLTIKKKLVIDTLKIINPIKLVNIDTTRLAEDPIWWKNRNSIGIDISEATFLNWNAGGNNSVSGLIKVNLYRSYKKLHTLWDNEIFIRYGLNSQQDRELRKTDDKLQVNSTFGYRKDTLTNWYYSIKFNFNTQFTDGFSYPNTEKPISRFFAPAYLFLGAGAYYDLKKESFSLYISPFTLKSTLVLDETLSNEGVFGVPEGKNSRNEFGALIQSSWDTEVIKNVIMKTHLSLYSDYLKDFGNVDVKWDLNFDLIINKYIKTNIGAYLIYDNDIKFKEDINNDGQLETLGARLQLKQLLGIGVLVTF